MAKTNTDTPSVKVTCLETHHHTILQTGSALAAIGDLLMRDEISDDHSLRALHREGLGLAVQQLGSRICDVAEEIEEAMYLAINKANGGES